MINQLAPTGLGATQDLPAQESLISDTGAFVELNHQSNQQSFQVYSKNQELVFEYDVESGKTRLFVPSGDLEIVAHAHRQTGGRSRATARPDGLITDIS